MPAPPLAAPESHNNGNRCPSRAYHTAHTPPRACLAPRSWVSWYGGGSHRDTALRCFYRRQTPSLWGPFQARAFLLWLVSARRPMRHCASVARLHNERDYTHDSCYLWSSKIYARFLDRG